MQGKTVLKDFDVVSAVKGKQAVVKEIPDVRVSRYLVVELVPKATKPSSERMPLINAIEVIREEQ